MDNGYRYLEQRPDSNYRQLFVRGRKLRAEVLYQETLGDEARTPEELAEDFELPVEAVREAIDYCTRNPQVLAEDYAREEANVQADWKVKPPLVPPGYRMG